LKANNMSKIILSILFLSAAALSFGQTSQKIELNKEYPNVSLDKTQTLSYTLKLEKGGVYMISVLQQGIDVKLTLADEKDNQILDKDSPNGQYGYEKFEFIPSQTRDYHLKIARLEEGGNPESGKVTILIKRLSKAEIELKEKIRKELEPENLKTVQTLDIDHFWEAFDYLKNCRTRKDSIETFQTKYLDRGTDGLKDFIDARDFTAEKFVDAVATFPKFYNSVRLNTFEVKNAEPLVEEIVAQFPENLSQLQTL
jgi:hypothetical protein